MILSQRFVGAIEAILSAAFFGLIPFFFLPLYAKGFTSEASLVYRFGFACLIMLFSMLIKRKSLAISFKGFSALTLVGIAYFLSALCLFSAINHMPSGIASTIFFINPIFVMLIMVLFFKEPLENYKILLSITTFFGVALLSGFFDEISAINITGLTYSILAGFFCSIYIIGLYKVQLYNIGKETLSFYLFLICTVISFCYSIITDTFILPPTCYDWAYLAVAAFVTAILSNLLLMSAIKKIGSVISAILGAAEPITAVVVGVMIFNEGLTLSTILGILIIIISVILLTTLPMIRQKKFKKLHTK